MGGARIGCLICSSSGFVRVKIGAAFGWNVVVEGNGFCCG